MLLQKNEYYGYMKSYSPVDNIQHADYPNILVTAGLHDPRVGYWYALHIGPVCIMQALSSTGHVIHHAIIHLPEVELPSLLLSA